MGIIYNCCKMNYQFEEIIDDIFSNLKIRKLTTAECLEIVKKKMPCDTMITETIFQQICNEVCIIDKRNEFMNSYWVRVYKNITKKKSLVLIFILLLLCKNNKNKDNIENYIQLFSLHYESLSTGTETEDYSEKKSKNTKSVRLEGEEIKELIYFYFLSISYITIDIFYLLDSNQQKVKENFNDNWNPNKILKFIIVKFFEHKFNLTDYIDFRKFLILNIDFLSNDSLIRREISEFKFETVPKGDEYYHIIELRKKNDISNINNQIII